MNPLIFVILIIMILFTVYHFWTDIRNAWNTGETFAEGMASAAPNGYTYTGESQCQDWNSHYVACKTALDGTDCSIKATTIDECAAECNKRDSCGEMYFKDGVCYLADGKCVPQTNPTNPQPHYKKGSGNNLVLDSPLSSDFSSGTQIKTDWDNSNTVTTTDAQGNTVTTTTSESSSVDPTTGAKIEKKCISVSELNSASAWVDHLFGTLGDTKCADKSKIDAAKTASKMDFISGVIKGISK